VVVLLGQTWMGPALPEPAAAGDHWYEMGGVPPDADGVKVTHCPAHTVVAFAAIETWSIPAAAPASPLP